MNGVGVAIISNGADRIVRNVKIYHTAETERYLSFFLLKTQALADRVILNNLKVI